MNEHFRSGFRNGNNQNFFLDTFRIPNMYVKKMCSSGVGEVTSLLYYMDLSTAEYHDCKFWCDKFNGVFDTYQSQSFITIYMYIIKSNSGSKQYDSLTN